MERYEDALFVLTKEDAQFMARDMIGRELSSEELRYVKKGLEYGLWDWADVITISIKEAIEAARFPLRSRRKIKR